MFAKGQWNAVCDRCGCAYKSGKIRREWTGLMVCHGAGTNGCWEARHPQDGKTGKTDRQTPPWSRPEAPDTFITTPVTWDDL